MRLHEPFNEITLNSKTVDTRIREWARLHYLDSEQILRSLRDIATTYPLHQLPYDVSSLRRRDLRVYGEGRQAALFCYAMSQVIHTPVSFAQSEASDYDIVARFVRDGVMHYVPVQLKELVPEHLNPCTELQAELDKISKYADSTDLVVAFHLNRSATFQLSELRLPVATVGSLWLYGAMWPDQSRWIIVGNLLEPNPPMLEFAYPGA